MDNRIHQKLEIELYVTGELDAVRSSALEKHLEQCDVCSAYVSDLKKTNQEFLRIYPFVDLIKPQPDSTAPWFKMWGQQLVRPIVIPACILLMSFAVILPFWGLVNKSTLRISLSRGMRISPTW